MKKSLVENSIYNILYKVVTALYPLVAVTYVSHVLEAEKMGMVSYAQNIVSYFAVIAALGLPTYGIREIAKRADDLKSRSKLYYELLFINFMSTSISLIVYLVLVFSVPQFSNNKSLYFVAGLQIFFNYMNVDWFFQGMEEYKYISIRSIIVKLVSLLLLPIMIHSPDDYLNYALIYCLAIAGNNLLNIIRVRKYVKFEKINIQSLRKHIKPVFTLLIASIAVEIYVMVDTTMLGFYCNNVIVGCYSNAMKLTRMVNTTAAAIGAVLLPRLSRLYEDNDKKRFNSLVNSAIKIMLTIAIPAMVGIIFLSDYIVLLFFGDTFYEAIPILKILSLMIPIVVCNTVLGGQVLVTCNMENKYVFTVVIASVVNVILNGLFIPIYGATSAAFASLISEIIDFILYLWFTRKIIRIKISPKFIISITIPLVIYLLFANNFIMPIFSTPILIVAINIIACVLIYFGLAALMGNESVIFILSKITSIIKRKCVKYKMDPVKRTPEKKR